MKITTLMIILMLSGSLLVTPAEAGWRGGEGRRAEPAETRVPLSSGEETTLRFMREEEKMARDVYLTLFDLWEDPVFENIARSEQKHMEAIKRLLEEYAITDPVIGDVVGVFENETLDGLYHRLMDEGGLSREKALRTGAYIEEIDILDLERAIDEAGQDDLIQVYKNLLRGSRNHLRAFVHRLENMGVVYEAMAMDQAELDAIVDSPMERGVAGRQHREGRGRSRRF